MFSFLVALYHVVSLDFYNNHDIIGLRPPMTLLIFGEFYCNFTLCFKIYIVKDNNGILIIILK